MAGRLAAKGWNVTVATTSPGTHERTVESCHGVRVERFPALAPGSAYFISKSLRLYARDLSEADVVHVHGVHAFPAYYGLSCSSPARVLTPHFHGSAHTFFRRILFRPYRRLFAARIRNIAWIAFVSKAEQSLFRHSFPASTAIPSCIIPNGVDLEAIKAAPPQNLGESAILVCGRLERYKHVDAIIRSLRWLPPQYRLHVVGSGPAESALRGLASNVAPGRVTFHANVDDETLYGMYKGAHVYVNLSEKEAFGITLLEAMAAGAPAVVLDSMGLAEVASGFPECAKTIRSLNPEDLAREVEAARASSVPDLSAFSWDRIASEHDELYQRITNDKPVHP